MYGFLEEKIQLVISQFIPFVLLSLLNSLVLLAPVLGQCPDNAVTENLRQSETGAREIYVYDSFNSGIDISGFEINIFNELTGSYVVKESNNFPSIGSYNNIELSKMGNRIQLNNIPEELDLSRCIVIIIGGDCPIKKIAITER